MNSKDKDTGSPDQVEDDGRGKEEVDFFRPFTTFCPA